MFNNISMGECSKQCISNPLPPTSRVLFLFLYFFHDPRCIFCCMRPCKSRAASYAGRRTVNHQWVKCWASMLWVKSLPTPSYCFHQYHSVAEMTLVLENTRTYTRTMRYALWSWEIEEQSLPRNAVRAPPNAGWQHQHRTVDTGRTANSGSSCR